VTTLLGGKKETHLEVSVVPGEAAGEGRLGHLRTPEGQEAVALGVGVLQGGRLPLVAAPGLPDGRHVALDVHHVEVAHARVAERAPLLALLLLQRAPLRESVHATHLARLAPETPKFSSVGFRSNRETLSPVSLSADDADEASLVS